MFWAILEPGCEAVIISSRNIAWLAWPQVLRDKLYFHNLSLNYPFRIWSLSLIPFPSMMQWSESFKLLFPTGGSWSCFDWVTASLAVFRFFSIHSIIKQFWLLFCYFAWYFVNYFAGQSFQWFNSLDMMASGTAVETVIDQNVLD